MEIHICDEKGNLTEVAYAASYVVDIKHKTLAFWSGSPNDGWDKIMFTDMTRPERDIIEIRVARSEELSDDDIMRSVGVLE